MSRSEIYRELDSLERKMERAMDMGPKRARELQARIAQNPIRVLNLRYDDNNGLQADPVTVETPAGTLTLQVTQRNDNSSPDGRFSPDGLVIGAYCLTPLRVLVSSFGLILPLEVMLTEPGSGNLDLVNTRTVEKGRVWLIVPGSGAYLWPRCTDIDGPIVSGHPRRGLLIFPLPTVSSNTVELHFDPSAFKSKPGSGGAVCRYSDESLGSQIEGAHRASDFGVLATDALNEMLTNSRLKVTRMRQELDEASKPKAQSSGCSFALVVSLLAASVLAASLQSYFS